jgi:lipopolysaccharide transport system ATP-binding protein
MTPAIRVEKLGKRYQIARVRQRYRTLRESLTDLATSSVRRLSGGGAEPRSEAYWALRDVDFEIQPGEIVGIIGRNGAGKSTLLKILSRITRPTTGSVMLHGRVGSLLEVGTGFHPELSGRENIFLNGSILGMGRREIARRFDEIVAFAEVESFLDTPIKRYSSGMYVRLAFAVAAHLETEILLVDEVLAVGDAQFQRKCLGKMEEVANGGRTIIFVSHQMNAVQRLCNQALLLDRGTVVAYESKASVIARYLAGGPGAISPCRWVDVSRLGRGASGGARFAALRFDSRNQDAAGHPYPDGPLWLDVAIDSDSRQSVERLAVSFCDRFGMRLVNADSIILNRSAHFREGRNHVRLEIESLHLNPGLYGVDLWMAGNGQVIDYVPGAVQVEVVDYSGGRIAGIRPVGDGVVTCDFDFSVNDPGTSEDWPVARLEAARG